MCREDSYSLSMPLGTVVRDVYTDGERLVMYEALEMLIRGNDWSRSGVYCFWDPAKCEALYIGLASNLPERFAQHNSLKGARPRKGNKGREIDEWFGQYERLGFSTILQEALADEEYEPTPVALRANYSRSTEGFTTNYRRGTTWAAAARGQHSSAITAPGGLTL